MDWPFAKKSGAKRDEIVAISLGSRTTNAVHLRRAGERLILQNYTTLDAPIYEKAINPEILGEHLQQAHAALGAKSREVVLLLSAGDSILRQAELPALPPDALRRLLKFNSRNVLQEDLSRHVFDCFELPPEAQAQAEPPPEGAEARSMARGPRQTRMLVGGVKEQTLKDVQEAARQAKLVPIQIQPAQTGPVNAVALLSEATRKGSFALIDFGFRHSSISLVHGGRLVLNRVVEIGGDKLTSGLAEAMNVSYSAAEGVKTVLAEKVQAKLKTLLAPMVHELLASVAYFQGQYPESEVSEVFLSGGSARSETIKQALQEEVHLPCTRWNPLAHLELALPAEKAVYVERDAPQLVSAMGAGVTCFQPALVPINLLAEQQEEEERRRRDPVRLGKWAAGGVVAIFALLALLFGLRLAAIEVELRRYISDLAASERKSRVLEAVSRETAVLLDDFKRLEQAAAGRFLGANFLNAMQEVVVRDVQLVHLALEVRVLNPEPPPASDNGPAPVSPGAVENVTLVLQGKDYGSQPALDAFIDRMLEVPYFKEHLQKVDPIRLRERSTPQVDPDDVSRTFIFFIIECNFAPRTL